MSAVMTEIPLSKQNFSVWTFIELGEIGRSHGVCVVNTSLLKERYDWHIVQSSDNTLNKYLLECTDPQ